MRVYQGDMPGYLFHEERDHYQLVNVSGDPLHPLLERIYVGHTTSTFYPDECRHGAPACRGCESWPQKIR